MNPSAVTGEYIRKDLPGWPVPANYMHRSEFWILEEPEAPVDIYLQSPRGTLSMRPS